MDHTLARNAGGDLDAAIDAYAADAYDLLARLVRVESVVGRETAAQEVLADALGTLGFAVEWLPLDGVGDEPAAGVPVVAAGDRRVVVGRLPGTGAGDGRSLLLN